MKNNSTLSEVHRDNLSTGSTPSEGWAKKFDEFVSYHEVGWHDSNARDLTVQAIPALKDLFSQEIATAKQEARQECAEKIKEALEVEKCCYTMHCGCLMENSGLRKNFDDLIKKLEEEK